MTIFAIGIIYPFDVAVQRYHDADPCEHRRAAEIGDEYERLDRGPAIPAARLLASEGQYRVSPRRAACAAFRRREGRSGRRIRVTNPGR
jgi:hypothetical protein